VLDSRIRLSHERTRNDYDRWQNRLNNVLKPLAVPAVMGVTITLFFFGILFGSLVSDPSALAAYDSASDGPIVATYKPISTPDTTIKRFGNTTRANLDQPLSIETNVTVAGLVSDYRIISGTRSAAVDKWLQEMLYFAQFRPATSFGVPVRSKIILSFVDVRL
jgi:hypothetical protein